MKATLAVVQDFDTRDYQVFILKETRGGVPVYERLTADTYNTSSEAARAALALVPQPLNPS